MPGTSFAGVPSPELTRCLPDSKSFLSSFLPSASSGQIFSAGEASPFLETLVTTSGYSPHIAPKGAASYADFLTGSTTAKTESFPFLSTSSLAHPE